eukprot:887486-Rhodomonas_salina.3
MPWRFQAMVSAVGAALLTVLTFGAFALGLWFGSWLQVPTLQPPPGPSCPTSLLAPQLLPFLAFSPMTVLTCVQHEAMQRCAGTDSILCVAVQEEFNKSVDRYYNGAGHSPDARACTLADKIDHMPFAGTRRGVLWHSIVAYCQQHVTALLFVFYAGIAA